MYWASGRPRVACFTSATYSYLDRVRTLFESVRAHHADWHTVLVLADEEPDGFELDLSREPFNQVTHLDQLNIPEWESWAFGHDIVELCTAVKGPALVGLLDQGFDAVIYLDPDILLFSALEEVLPMLETHSAVLTPHQLTPDVSRQAIADNEGGSLRYGIFNLGFLAVRNQQDGRRFARWWADRLGEFCIDDPEAGLFTDQKWCNHVPVFFPEVGILRHAGYNVASWNLSQRALALQPDGCITAAGQPLRFFHFSKVGSVGPDMLARYAGGNSLVHELAFWYMRQLERYRAKEIPVGWWYYGRYTDGRLISTADRRAHRALRERRMHRANPFVA